MMHVPAKFRENTEMRFRVTVQKLNVMDGQSHKRTDGGRFNMSRPGRGRFNISRPGGG